MRDVQPIISHWLEEKQQVYDMIRSNELRLLYVTPEMVASSGQMMSRFQRLAKKGQLKRFVIDEAHCVSQWVSALSVSAAPLAAPPLLAVTDRLMPAPVAPSALPL